MPNGFSNLATRILVAVVAIPAILTLAYLGGLFFFPLITLIVVLALWEFYTLSEAKGAHPQKIVGIITAILLTSSFFHEQLQQFLLPIAVDRWGGIALLTKLQLLITVGLIMMTISLLYELFRNKGSAILNLSTTFLGAIYIGLSMGTFLGIRELFGFEFPYWLSRQYLPTGGAYDDLMVKQLTYPWGGWMIIAILATIWMCDTAAYFGGLSMGKHHLFPRVSPKKTWEGAVWGFLAAVGTMMGARALVLPFLELHQAIVMGVVIGSLGQLGDLVESLFKRDAGVKDSSTLIPGHGGAFDRFDSLIFVSPILYLYLDFVVLS